MSALLCRLLTGSFLKLVISRLFAHNSSDIYDAKVFEVTSLLSHRLLYNTVKFVRVVVVVVVVMLFLLLLLFYCCC